MTRGIVMINTNKSFRIAATESTNSLTYYNADFLKLKFDSNSVDLIITSPPYNIGIDYKVYKDNQTYKDYLDFSKNWLSKAFNVLKQNGRICINIPLDTGKDTKRSISADLTILAKRAGFKYKGTIIWNKQSVRNKFSMVFSKNIEVILIFYKGNWKPVGSEYKGWVNEIWQFSGESAKRVGHPAPFPVELPRRLIKMLSEKGDLILDPFSGSGTTMLACKLLGRKGIGVEISEEYFKLAKDRIKLKNYS